MQCTLSTGSGFGQTLSSSALDPGYDDSRSWADVNGDGKADYCRFTGSAFYSSTNVQCTMSVGWAFSGGFTTPPMDAGYGGMSGWADVDGDGRADFCRIVGSYSGMCTLSTGTGLGASFSHPLSRYGPIAWPDVNGDGRADECLLPGSDGKVVCTLSNGTSFGTTWSATA